jgi:hypothetical protein
VVDVGGVDEAMDGLVAGDAGLMKMASTTARPAVRSAALRRSAKAMRSGNGLTTTAARTR